eukprot:gb/GECG01009460.1/.p1 GENE.gb/GECG01009460.1/~~gb/GECG01009460.1/.p1  ORF type:complete len:752 (+),score=75.15 gb/GECG01009460.1/:1-2256(+)
MALILLVLTIIRRHCMYNTYVLIYREKKNKNQTNRMNVYNLSLYLHDNVDALRRHAELFAHTDTLQLFSSTKGASDNTNSSSSGLRKSSPVNIISALEYSNDNVQRVKRQLEECTRSQATGQEEAGGSEVLKRRKTRFEAKHSKLCGQLATATRCVEALSSFHGMLTLSKEAGYEAFKAAIKDADSEEIQKCTWGPCPEARIPHPFGFYLSISWLAGLIYSLRADGHDIALHSMCSEECSDYTVEMDSHSSNAKVCLRQPKSVPEGKGGEYEVFIETVCFLVEIKIQTITGHITAASIISEDFKEETLEEASASISKILQGKQWDLLYDVLRSLCCKTRATDKAKDYPSKLKEYFDSLLSQLFGTSTPEDNSEGLMRSDGVHRSVHFRRMAEGPALLLDRVSNVLPLREFHGQAVRFGLKEDTSFPHCYQGFVFRNISPLGEKDGVILSRGEEVLVYDGVKTTEITHECLSLSVELLQPVLLSAYDLRTAIKGVLSSCSTGSVQPVLLMGDKEWTNITQTPKGETDPQQSRTCTATFRGNEECSEIPFKIRFDAHCKNSPPFVSSRRVFGVGFKSREVMATPPVGSTLTMIKECSTVFLRSWKFHQLVRSLITCEGDVYGFEPHAKNDTGENETEAMYHLNCVYDFEQCCIFATFVHTGVGSTSGTVSTRLYVNSGGDLECTVYALQNDVTSIPDIQHNSYHAQQLWLSFRNRQLTSFEQTLRSILRNSLQEGFHVPFAFYALLKFLSSGI